MISLIANTVAVVFVAALMQFVLLLCSCCCCCCGYPCVSVCGQTEAQTSNIEIGLKIREVGTAVVEEIFWRVEREEEMRMVFLEGDYIRVSLSPHAPYSHTCTQRRQSSKNWTFF